MGLKFSSFCAILHLEGAKRHAFLFPYLWQQPAENGAQSEPIIATSGLSYIH